MTRATILRVRERFSSGTGDELFPGLDCVTLAAILSIIPVIPIPSIVIILGIVFVAGELLDGLFYPNCHVGSGLTAGSDFGRRAGRSAAPRFHA